MTKPLLKCRVTRESGKQLDLAWNVHDYEIDYDSGIVLLKHSRGEVLHRMAAGDTISMLEQMAGGDHD